MRLRRMRAGSRPICLRLARGQLSDFDVAVMLIEIRGGSVFKKLLRDGYERFGKQLIAPYTAGLGGAARRAFCIAPTTDRKGLRPKARDTAARAKAEGTTIRMERPMAFGSW